MAESPNAASIAALLESDHLGDRLHAVNAMRSLGEEDALRLLTLAARDDRARVRYAAISQLGTQTSNPTKALLDLLRFTLKMDPEVDVRAAAAAALGDLKQSSALPDLLTAYERETEWLVLFSIVAALGELGDRQAFETLVGALQQENDLIRTAAAAALGDLGDPRAVEILAPLATESDWQLRYRVCLALGQLGGTASRMPLTQLAQDEVEQIATQAQAALAGLE